MQFAELDGPISQQPFLQKVAGLEQVVLMTAIYDSDSVLQCLVCIKD